MAKKENTVKAHIIPRSGTAADWTLVNPVLLAGELGVETDTGRFKFGNGANPWNELPYSGESGGGLTEIPVATENTLGGIKSGPIDAGNVVVDQHGLAHVYSIAKLATARTIALTGEVTGSTTFDGSKNVSINANIGTLVGLSLNVDIITSTTATLSATDCVVFVKANTTAVTLPVNPRAGQVLLIRNIANNSKTTLKVGNSNHYINDGLYNKKQTWAWTEACFFILIWDVTDLTWHASYMRAN